MYPMDVEGNNVAALIPWEVVEKFGGERHLFLKLWEVWEEGFSVPSPFFLAGGRGFGGGLGEVIEGGLGFVEEGGEEGEGWVGG